jgi:hypothetical protein
MTFALLGILALHSGGALLAFSRPFRTAPFRTAPFRTAPFRTAPFRTAPFRTAPFRTAPGRATGTKLLVLCTGEAPEVGLASGRLRPS